jgi:hypothetical protein
MTPRDNMPMKKKGNNTMEKVKARFFAWGACNSTITVGVGMQQH